MSLGSFYSVHILPEREEQHHVEMITVSPAELRSMFEEWETYFRGAMMPPPPPPPPRHIENLKGSGVAPENVVMRSESPFVPNILVETLAPSVKIPELSRYDGDKDHKEHLTTFEYIMQFYGVSDTLNNRIFITTIYWRRAQERFGLLVPATIVSYDQLSRKFLHHFAIKKKAKRLATHLFPIRQKNNEALGDFIDRFNTENLLVGGTDNTATTVEWIIREILRLSRTIEKAKEELDRVIERDKWVEEKDHFQLPYIDAIIMESMRLHPLATLLAPHYAMEDCKIAGYDVAKGTTVIINTWGLGRDPNSWDSPLEFLPERFLNKGIDITGSNFAMLPFGSGWRRCLGYDLGLKIVRTTLANLLHGFELILIEGMKPKDVSLEEVYALTTHPKEPLTIIIESRLPEYLY
ncbi:UNVERIFIED_CONTAM: Trimethyltridecatetraene synthase [Sesamum latifolium]|uniref:Trimethyltridecatetraene synthase n=1 Tax=Sesamum latifolium TaxID=2727402 RepID=A0AAW2SUN9_9LAMI